MIGATLSALLYQMTPNFLNPKSLVGEHFLNPLNQLAKLLTSLISFNSGTSQGGIISPLLMVNNILQVFNKKGFKIVAYADAHKTKKGSDNMEMKESHLLSQFRSDCRTEQQITVIYKLKKYFIIEINIK